MVEQFILQLDTLVPFLGLAQEGIFEIIHDENQEWFTEQQRRSLPETFAAYSCQVSISAFLLGYSYFEAFIADLAKKILLSRPELLPKDKKLTFGEIIDAKTYNVLLTQIVEQQVFSVMCTSAEKIADYYSSNLHIKWPVYDEKYSFFKASLIRNCYMHNGGIVDSRLSKAHGLQQGEEIILSPEDVHSYGIEIRQLAHYIYDEAKTRYLSD
jgi:hypothetical protein